MKKYILISGGDLNEEQNTVEGYFESVEDAKAYAKAHEITPIQIYELVDNAYDLAKEV